MDIKNLGQIIELRRTELSLKQEDVAEMSGLTVRTIYNIEHGKGNPSIETLIKLLEVLGLDLNIDIRKPDE